MKLCPNCRTENQDDVKFCKNCGASLSMEETKSNEASLVVHSAAEPVPIQAAPVQPVYSVSTPMNAAKKPPVILENIKAWIKDPISIISASLNGFLLVLAIILLIVVASSGSSAQEEIANYAQTNSYVLAEFDKYNSPASENGLGNTKVYFSGKVKELTTVDSYKIAMIEDSNSTGNTWCVMFLDNYIYSKLKENMKITVFGYYIGYSSVKNAPTVYYANGYFNGEWNEYEDSIGILASLENKESQKLIEDGEFTVTKDEMVNAINTIENVMYIPMEIKGDGTYFYSGQIEKGVDCTIVCETDGETIKAIQITGDTDKSKEAAAFFSEVIRVIDSESHDKTVSKILKKWDLDNKTYGDTATCVVNDVYYVADFTHINEIVLSIMPVGDK